MSQDKQASRGKAPSQASIEELIQCCQLEQARTQAHEPVGASFCFELFRRAVVEGSQQAWDAVCAQYRDQMVLWARWNGDDAHSAQDTAHNALARFQNAVTPPVFARFSGLASVHAYLKRCVKSVQIDRWRQAEREQRAWARFEVERSSTQSTEQVVLDDVANQDCAAYVYSRLQDEQERLVVYLNIELGLKPAEIARQHPVEFPTAGDVSRVRERVIRRLSEDPILRSKYGA